MTAAIRCSGAGSSRSGRRTTISPTPASASSRNRPIWSSTVPACTRRRVPRPGRRRAVAAGPPARRPRPGYPPDQRGGQVRQLDRAPGLGAVRGQHLGLAGHRRQVAEHVGHVGVARGQPQRAPLAAPAEHDRHPLLQRPRVAGGVRQRQHPPVERLPARPPQHRQRRQRVLQQRVALADRRERPAVGPVLGGEPAQAEPAHRAPPLSTSSVATIFARCPTLR